MKENNRSILEIHNLKKFFRNKNIVNKAVDDVSFDLKEGEIVGLIGESGSGKTTIGRSLLRLYDDFNGFVRLDGKLISGKKITRKTNKFLHKNIQMIFQDPMASLNGQNTIFSILKEPLVVNGIIKNKIKDIRIDWSEIKNNFHYTFLEYSLKLKLENLKINTNLSSPFMKKWSKRLDKIEFKDQANDSYDDLYNSYFSYLDEKNKINSKIINSLYANTEKLLNFYKSKQLNFRNEEIDFDEENLKKAKNRFILAKQLTKKTESYYKYKNLTKENWVKFKENLATAREVYVDSNNSTKNLASELKNEAKLLFNEAYSSPYIDIFAYKIKLYELNRHVYKLFKKNRSKLAFLNYESLQELIYQIEDDSREFFVNYLKFEPYDFDSLSKYKNKIRTFINDEFKLDIKQYLETSAKIKQDTFKSVKESFKELYSSLKSTIKNFFVSPKKEFEFKEKINELEESKKEYLEAKKVADDELSKYVIEYKNRILKINDEIQQQELLLKEIKDQEKIYDSKFNQIHKQFVKYYHENTVKKLKDNLSKVDNKNKLQIEKIKDKIKQHQVELKVYQTNVETKWNSNNSFYIESKYLNKDLNNIYILMGISKFELLSKNKWYSYVLEKATLPYKLFKLNKLLTRVAIYKSLEDVGLLKQFAYRYPHEFSGGQRQRIVIARALITEPKVIVADEPIASLDISIQAQVVNLLKDLCREKNIGMIFIAHDLSMIEYIADRVQIMHLGKIVESGKTEEIYKKPLHPYTINLFKAIPKISNANEKFKGVKFELSYMKDQIFPNIPYVHQIEDKNHFVLGTNEQIEDWTK
ncbi:ATP-binding cassette domain-containing protein [Mycoplasma sp. CSL10166]|uniref:ATP-binding cassette domain-containing protein n=1 Tax=Mycoplasma sp. CSL10166 TaxID=2813825 RepID=UPI00197BEABA|nr:ATP-binding cassette domain-containing protein [Mycoplasma sp. CSL10166]MBN4084185.1 ATP-binding cassette domain-containing protein [Mycoplasma sp. CSL10166]